MKVSEADFLSIKKVHETLAKTPFVEENIPIYEKLVEQVIKILGGYFKEEDGVLENELRFHQIFVQRIMLPERNGKILNPSKNLYYCLSMIYEKKLDLLQSIYEQFTNLNPNRENIPQLADLIDTFSSTMLEDETYKKSLEISKNQLHIGMRRGGSVGYQRAKETMKIVIKDIEMYL